MSPSHNTLPRLLSRGAALLGMCAAVGNFAASADAAYNPVQARFPKALGTHALAMVSVNFAGQRPLPFGNAVIEQQTFEGPGSVADYYHRASFGQFTLKGEVLGPVTLSPDVLGRDCSVGDLAKVGALANKAVTQQTGLKLNSFTDYGYTLSRDAATAGCDFGGSTQGDSFVDLETRTRYGLTPHRYYEGGVVHEFGHANGLSHANEYRCHTKHRPVIFSIARFMNDQCREIDYGDPVDPMGDSATTTGMPPDMSAINKARLGWLKPSNIHTMRHSGIAFIAPLETKTDRTQLVRIPDGLTSNNRPHYYYLDFRQPVNLDSSLPPDSPLVKGVAIREAGSLSVNDNSVEPLGNFIDFIDTTPGTKSAVDGTLQPGKTFKDSSAGIQIHTLSARPKGAKVSVRFLNQKRAHNGASTA